MALEHQFVNHALAASALMHHQILQLFQPVQMPFQLRIAPPGERAHVLAAETEVLPLDLFPLAVLAHHFVHQEQQAPRLRRQFVERAPQHFMRETIRHCDVVFRDLDVLQGLAAMHGGLVWALMLIEKRNRADQRQVFHVIAPRPGLRSRNVNSRA